MWVRTLRRREALEAKGMSITYRNLGLEAGSHLLSPQPGYGTCGGLSLGCQGNTQAPASEEGCEV